MAFSSDARVGAQMIMICNRLTGKAVALLLEYTSRLDIISLKFLQVPT